MAEILLALLVIAVAALTVAVVLVYRRLWLVMGSVECLCNNLGRLRQQVGHEHAPMALEG